MIISVVPPPSLFTAASPSSSPCLFALHPPPPPPSPPPSVPSQSRHRVHVRNPAVAGQVGFYSLRAVKTGEELTCEWSYTLRLRQRDDHSCLIHRHAISLVAPRFCTAGLRLGWLRDHGAERASPCTESPAVVDRADDYGENYVCAAQCPKFGRRCLCGGSGWCGRWMSTS